MNHLFCNQLKEMCYTNEPCYLCNRISEEEKKVLSKDKTKNLSEWLIVKDEEGDCYVCKYPVRYYNERV